MENDLPCSEEHEAALLGLLLSKPGLAGDVIDVIGPEHFAFEAHAAIFTVISEAAAAGHEADHRTVATRIAHTEALRAVGGMQYLSALVANSLSFIDVGQYARVIRDLADRRGLWSIATAAAARAKLMDDPAPAKAQVEELESQLALLVSNDRDADVSRSFSDVMQSALKQVEAAWSGQDFMTGIATGFGPLDRRLRGLRAGEVYVLAARPSMGKSALATNIALNVARSGAHAAIFSMEMSSERLANRMLADVSGVAAVQLDSGDMTADEWSGVANAGVAMEKLPLSICERAAASPAYVRSEAKRLMRKRGPMALLVIDYLQLMQASQWSRGKNRVTELSEITGEIKQLAKELRVPVLLLSQLSRNVEQREDKRPQLSDLRDSGSIEQDADVVMFIYREEYYLSRAEPEMGTEKYDKWWHKLQASKRKAEVITAKFREGAAGRDMLGFDPSRVRFYDPDEGANEWQPEVKF